MKKYPTIGIGIGIFLLLACLTAMGSDEPANTLQLHGCDLNFGTHKYDVTKQTVDTISGTMDGKNWVICLLSLSSAGDYTEQSLLEKISLKLFKPDQDSIHTAPQKIDEIAAAFAIFNVNDAERYAALYCPFNGWVCVIESDDEDLFLDITSTIHIEIREKKSTPIPETPGKENAQVLLQGNNTYVLNGHTVTFGNLNYGDPNSQTKTNYFVEGICKGYIDAKPFTSHWSVAVVPVSSFGAAYYMMSMEDLMTIIISKIKGVQPGTINVEKSLVDGREGAIGVYTADSANGGSTTYYWAFSRLPDGNVTKFEATEPKLFKDMTNTLHTESA